MKTLTLENFRCFEKAELGPFDPQFNLLVGENGAGKSSVLVALADFFVNSFTRRTAAKLSPLVTSSDIRVRYSETDKGWEGPVVAGVCSIGMSLISSGSEFDVGSKIRSLGEERHFSPALPNIIFDVKGVSRIIAYYPTGRKFIFTKDAPRIISASDNRILAFENWMYAGRDYNELREWLKEQTLLALQVEQRQKDGKAAVAGLSAQSHLRLVHEAILAAVDDVRGLEYDAEVSDIVLRKSSGARELFSQMSDGQRLLVGLVTDLVRRVCLLNGSQLKERTLLDTPGLVLIDEIDLHLHPKWQRQIVPALKKIFPKIQFFATTHSPQVIGECKPEEIVLLTPQGQKRPGPSGSYGMDSNWILECVMEAEGRDPEIGKRIKSLFDLIEADRLDEAKAEIRKLREELPAVAPDIVSAEAYIWNLEHGADEAAE